MDSDQEERMEMIRDFINEARELLDDAEPQIIDMEKTALGSGRVDEEILNAIFRLFHSLKGTASFLDFQAIIGVTHEAETLLDIFRKGKAEITPYHVDLLCRTTDFVRSILDVVERRFSDEGFEEETESLINDLRQTIAAISGEDTFTGGDEGAPGNGRGPVLRIPSGRAESPDAEEEEEAPDLNLMFAPDNRPATAGDQPFSEAGPEDTPAPGGAPGLEQENAPWPGPEEVGLRITPEMIKSFSEETMELCEDAESALLALERMPDAESARQAFRAFHSIKGNAGFFGYGDLERLSHLAENVLDQIRNGEPVCDPATMSVLLKVVDAVRSKTSDLSLGGAGEITDIDQLCDRLVHLVEDRESRPAELRGERREVGGYPPGALTPSISQYSLASPLAKELEQLGAGDEIPDSGVTAWPEEGASSPVLAGQAEEARPSLDEEILKLGLADLRSEKLEVRSEKKDLKALIEGVAAESGVRSGGAGSAPGPPDMAPPGTGAEGARLSGREGIGEANTDKDLTSNLSPRTSQLAGRQPETKPVPGKLRAGPSDGTVGASSAGSAPGGATPGGPGAVIRVDIDKLDKMLDLVGELVIAELMVSNNQDLNIFKNERFGKAVTQLDKISREIQEVAMSMRMIPLAGVFRKMMRLVRDLAQKANKQVQLEIIGEETEVDKTIIEQISDPLVHLIRNAVDHGLETPAERLAAGKPETGRVTLEAKHSAGEVWITIEDDGRGLNRGKIFQKGVEKGLVKSEDREMKDEDIWRLIFEPGFSTAEQVSSISGRGVGMDVVKRNIERLRGKVDIRSRAGVGTIFAVRIPLTLAIIEGMVVRVGAHRYTIPISSIKESFRPGREQITRTPDGLEIVRIRGELQPVLRLHELYRVDPRYYQLSEGILIMVENSDNKFCLFVDELLGQQQIVIKGLPGYLNHVKGISGCAILGDGEISLILDIAGLISSVDEIMH